MLRLAEPQRDAGGRPAPDAPALLQSSPGVFLLPRAASAAAAVLRSPVRRAWPCASTRWAPPAREAAVARSTALPARRPRSRGTRRCGAPARGRAQQGAGGARRRSVAHISRTSKQFRRHSPRARRAGVPAAGVPVCRGRVHDAGGELPTAAHRAAQGAPRRPRRALLWAHGCRVSCCPAHERRLCGIGPPSSSLLPLAAGCQSVRMQAVWLLMRWRFLRNTFCLLLLGCRVPPRVNSPSRRPGSDNCPCCGVDASSSRAASGRRDGARHEAAAARRGSCWRVLAGV